MYCPKCGTEAPDGASFCSACGKDLGATTPMAAVREKRQTTEIDVVKGALRHDYEILGELGRGGMAIVYRAREIMLDREVAIKVLPFSLAFDKDFVERFQREARTAAKLEHPNIIPIYRVGKVENVIYFAMRFLRGKSLAQVIEEKGAMSPRNIRRLLSESASALGYAHKHDIVHRDIKPDNIMFKESGEAVLCDFGIAKAATGTRLTGTGMAIGTPYYMSPEQARAQPLDGRSDLYSLGVVAFQCLTGQVPFQGEDSFAIGYKHIMEELPTPDLRTAEERTLFHVIQRMMAKDPAHRYQTAGDLVAELESRGPTAVLVPPMSSAPTTPIDAIPAVQIPTPHQQPHLSGGVAGRPATPTTPMPPASPPSTSKGKKRRKSGMLVGMALVLLVGGVGGGGYYYLQVMGGSIPFLSRGSDPSEPPTTGGEVGQPERASDPVASRPTDAAPESLRTLAAQSIPDSGVAEPVVAAEGTQDSTPTPPRDSLPAPPAPPRQGELVLSGMGQNAALFLNGRNVRGLQHTLDPGSYRIRVERDGYRNYEAEVEIRAGEATRHRVAMMRMAPPRDDPPAAPASQCDLPGPSYNRNGECFDVMPRPREATLVPLTAQIEGTPTPAILAIKVDAQGSVQQVEVAQRSDNDQFTILAVEFARDLEFVPAQKNGRPIVAWSRVPFLPAARQ